VGFYNAIGCKGRKRLIQVTFVDDEGQAIPASNNSRRC
jgi:hypothetical protein